MTLVIAFVTTTYKWHYLLARRGRPIQMRTLIALNLTSALYATVLPGQLAGEGVKAFRLVQGREDRSLLAASIVIDRLSGLWGIVLVGAVALSTSSDPPAVASAAFGIAAAGMIALSLVLLRTPRDAAPRASRLRTTFAAMRRAVRVYHSDATAIGVAVALSVVYQFALSVSVWCFARSLDLDVGIATIGWVFAATSVAQMIPVSVAGIGTRDVTLVGFLAGQGVGSSGAVALSTLVLAGLLLFALGGLVVEWGAVIPHARPTLDGPTSP